MFDYTGYECKICSKKFSEDDDIVVCPDCGTPYHKECYKETGKCINTELHEKNISWKAENEAAAQNAAEIKCRNCGKLLGAEQLFCDKCGTPSETFFKSKNANGESSDSYGGYGSENGRIAMETIHPYMINYSDPLCGFNPEEEYSENVTLRDVGDYVKTNTHYYLPKFRLMKSLNFKLSFNFSAMLFPEFYFANRKMPMAAAMILIIKTIIGFPATAVTMQRTFSNEMFRELFKESMPFAADVIDKLMNYDFTGAYFSLLLDISSVLSWIIIFICAGFSNYFYYRHVINKVKAIKTDAQLTGGNTSEILKTSGGTSWGMLALFIVLYFLSSYISMGAVFLLI